MKPNRMAAIGLLIAMTCVSRTSMAVGGNRIPNGEFDMNLSGWTFPNGLAAVWTSEDSADQPESGSIEIRHPYVFDIASAVSSLVPVTGSTTYRFSTSARVTSDAGAGGVFAADLYWFDELNGGSVGAHEEIRFSRTTWTTVTRTVTAPATATAAHVRLWVLRTSGSQGLLAGARFDAVRLIALSTGGSTTTTVSSCSGSCGDPVTNAAVSARSEMSSLAITATDARYILRAAVGVEICDDCVCDVDGNGTITAGDALLDLTAAVDSSVVLLCPPE